MRVITQVERATVGRHVAMFRHGAELQERALGRLSQLLAIEPDRVLDSLNATDSFNGVMDYLGVETIETEEPRVPTDEDWRRLDEVNQTRPATGGEAFAECVFWAVVIAVSGCVGLVFWAVN